MSIKINGKTIAGLCIPNSASKTEEGVIRIATDEEAKAGELTNVAVTPKQLAENGGTEVDTSNLVTLDGEQTITGAKTFGSDVQLGSNSLSFSDGALTLNPQGSSNLNITTMGGALDVTGNLTLTGNIKAYKNQSKPIELRSDGSTMSMVYGDNTLNMSDDSLTYTNASGETKDLLAGGGSSDNVVTLDTNQTITGTKVFNESVQYSNPQYYKDVWIGQTGPGNFGLVFQSNNSPYEFYIYNQGYTASSLNVSGFGGGVKFANTVNFNSSIYDKDGNEIVGGNSGGGSIDISNLVDLTTEQTITANKTIGYGKQLKLESGTTSYNGAIYGGGNTAGNFILECQNQSGNIPESIILGAQGNGTDYNRRGIFLSVPTNEAIYLGYPSYACKVEAVNDLKLYGGYKQNSYLHLSNDELKYTKSDGTSIDLLANSGGGGSSGESEWNYGTLDWNWNYDYYSGSFGWLHHEPSGIMIQGGQLPYFSGNLEAVAVVNFEKPYKTLCSIIVFDVYDKILFSTIQLWDDIDEEGNQGILGFELEEQPHMDTYWIAFGY